MDASNKNLYKMIELQEKLADPAKRPDTVKIIESEAGLSVQDTIAKAIRIRGPLLTEVTTEPKPAPYIWG